MDLRASFLADIVANPADDTPRLIYADWLEEEAGEPLRAEFIRVGIDLGRRRIDCCIRQVPEIRCRRAGCGLCRTEKLMYAGQHTCPPLPGKRVLDIRWCERRNLAWPHTVGARGVLFFHRGFPAGITTSQDLFMEHASALFAACPIEHVLLMDRQPFRERLPGCNPRGEANCLFFWDSRSIPPVLFDRMPCRLSTERRNGRLSFASEKAAVFALSQAALAYGRTLARPPALVEA